MDVSLGTARTDRNGVSQYAKILLDNNIIQQNFMHRAHALVRETLLRHSERMKRNDDKKVNDRCF